jgi:hypothetical protein
MFTMTTEVSESSPSLLALSKCCRSHSEDVTMEVHTNPEPVGVTWVNPR